MQQYLDLLKKIKEEGIDSEDRTGVGTRSIFGHQMRFDLQNGFPLVTTKKVYWKGVVYELLWFLRGDTNIKYLTDHNVNIWNCWRRPYDFDRRIVLVKKKQKEYVPYKGIFPIKASEAGLSDEDKKLCHTWIRMMNRCYNKNDDRYQYYGAKNVSVSEKWHDVKTFIEEVKKVPQYYYKKNDWNNFELDKDYYKANQYGLDTCVWLHKSENISKEWIIAIDPNGEIGLFDSIHKTAKDLGLSKTSVHRFVQSGNVVKHAKQKNKKILGWKFFNLSEKDSQWLVRRKIIEDGDMGPIYGSQWRNFGGFENGCGVDQIANVIESIKNNPLSRRHIICTWNPIELPKMALPPCHAFIQFYVRNGKLSCQLYQRSCDAFLGLPFNIASYSLLTHMIAKMCDLEVGEFVWTGGDVHIYHNHFDQVDLQLTREPLPLPTLNVKVKRDKIEDYDFDDFELINYQSYDKIPAPIAV